MILKPPDPELRHHQNWLGRVRYSFVVQEVFAFLRHNLVLVSIVEFSPFQRGIICLVGASFQVYSVFCVYHLNIITQFDAIVSESGEGFFAP